MKAVGRQLQVGEIFEILEQTLQNLTEHYYNKYQYVTYADKDDIRQQLNVITLECIHTNFCNDPSKRKPICESNISSFKYRLIQRIERAMQANMALYCHVYAVKGDTLGNILDTSGEYKEDDAFYNEERHRIYSVLSSSDNIDDIESTSNDDGDSLTDSSYMTVLRDSSDIDKAVDDVTADTLKEDLDKIMFKLTPREREILNYRYISNKTLKQISDETGLGIDLIRIIEAKALRRLRTNVSFRSVLKTYIN